MVDVRSTQKWLIEARVTIVSFACFLPTNLTNKGPTTHSAEGTMEFDLGPVHVPSHVHLFACVSFLLNLSKLWVAHCACTGVDVDLEPRSITLHFPRKRTKVKMTICMPYITQSLAHKTEPSAIAIRYIHPYTFFLPRHG